jgi:hypothetical protein
LTDYLTTEELLAQLRRQAADTVSTNTQSKKKTKKFKINKRVLYWILFAIAITHLIYISIPMILPDRGLGIVRYTNVIAVPIDQEVVVDETGFEISATVVLIEKFDPEKLEVGDLVVIYGKFGSNVYWVERVASFNIENQTLTTTLDGYIASEDVNSFDEIEGFFVRRATLVGTLTYVSSNTRGYLVMLTSHALVLSILYYLYIRDKDKANQKKKKKNKKNFWAFLRS